MIPLDFKATLQAPALAPVSNIQGGAGVESDKEKRSVKAKSPNSALQRTALTIKCLAAGGQAQSAHERWRARVLLGHLAVAELGS